MANLNVIEGALVANGEQRFAIVAARFNSLVVDRLVDGAVDALVRHGVAAANIDLVRVPGAYELPLALRKVAGSKRYAAVVAVGAVIKGDTSHFDFVAGECASGVSRAMHESDVPVAFAVLTTDTLEQALDRAGGKAGNKGADCALAALEMANLLQRLEG